MSRDRKPEEGVRLVGRAMLLVAAVLLFIKAALVGTAACTVQDMGRYEGVTVSPDGTAWTTDYMDRTQERLPEGFTIQTGKPSSIRPLRVGEHYYQAPALGSVTIGAWQVVWSNAQCIHYFEAQNYKGFDTAEGTCGGFYNNGWIAYCADCMEPIADMHIYATSKTIQGIETMPGQSTYLYLCPHCHGLEQGTGYQHMCRRISANRYQVRYEPNGPVGAEVRGYMLATKHMYDNASVYEGCPAADLGYDDRTLRPNAYDCRGYTFVGWATTPSGSGERYEDGCEVLNLTEENEGVITLYAQWRPAESELVVDADGGSYCGREQYSVRQAAGTCYRLLKEELRPPVGYGVTFEENGGSPVEDLTTTKSLSHWEFSGDFAGSMEGDIYMFPSAEGHRDVLKAAYIDDGFVLPDTTKANESLAGWYGEADFSEESFLGKPGDVVSVYEDTTLYAKWVTLTLWAEDDYEAHQGVGAVDLTWEQRDGRSKYYKLYQSADGVSWQEITESGSDGEEERIEQHYGPEERGAVFSVESTGYYGLRAYGAGCTVLGEAGLGEKGHGVSAEYWLKKGDLLRVYPGEEAPETGQSSEVYLQRGEENILLLRAVGGRQNRTPTTVENSPDFALKSGLSQNLEPGTVQVYGMERQLTEPAMELVTGTEQQNWRNITELGPLPSEFSGDYELWDKYWPEDAKFFEYSRQEAQVGSVPYIQTRVRGGVILHLEQTYDTGDNSALLVGGGLYRYSYGAPGGTHLDLMVLNAETGEQIYAQRVYSGYAGDKESGIAFVESIDLSEARRVTIRLTASTEGTQAETLGHSSQLYISDIIFWGGRREEGGTEEIQQDYIHTGFGCRVPLLEGEVCHGAGYVELEGRDVGYREGHSLEDVLARDMAAPESVSSYMITETDVGQVRVKLEEPTDHGTAYRHRAESFALEEQGIVPLAVSNITHNILTTGVKGYYYYVDANPVGEADEGHIWTESDSLSVTLTDPVVCLHVAAVDVAGNISPTKSIRLEKRAEEPEAWAPKPYTERLVLRETEYVYSPDGRTYYVKADGATEHMLYAEAGMENPSHMQSQVDSLQLSLADGLDEAWVRAEIPRCNATEGTASYRDGEILLDRGGNGFRDYGILSVYAERREHGAKLWLEQGFCVGAEQGIFEVFPQAISEEDGVSYFSAQEQDLQNGLLVIPDGIPPRVEGLEELAAWRILDMTEGDAELTVHAFDEESGLKEFYVTVRNRDNFLERTYTANEAGDIVLRASRVDPLFVGELEFVAVAGDRVGNLYTTDEETFSFALTATLERQREPQEGCFMAGDGAVLRISTMGYAERVEVEFPDRFLAANPDMNRVYEYRPAALQKGEVLEFHVPLGVATGDYEIMVYAWKNGQMLVSRPTLLVVDGTVLDELRTRIRSNG